MGSHSALLLCRAPRPRDIDGQWLTISGRLSNAQALQVAWSVFSADVLTIGLCYAFAPLWQPPLASLPDFLLRGIPIVVAALVCVLATGASRLTFRGFNVLALKLRKPPPPDAKPGPPPMCDAPVAVALLGWLVVLGSALGCVGYFALATLDLQKYDGSVRSIHVMIDVGAALAVAWLVLEPVAIGVPVCAKACKKEKIAVAAEEAPAAAPAAAAEAPAEADLVA